ncbi:unnamed protein product [Leuciscus chuanchicus]
MEESFPFPYSLLEYLFTLVGLLLFLLDIALDIWTVVSFYQHGDYVYMAVMIFLLLGSSVLLQVFSWLWYSDSLEIKVEETKLETKAEEIKLETKVEDTKLETKVEEIKLETKAEETKLETKVEDTKLETKAEEIKLETKVEDTKLETKVEDTKLETKAEEIKLETKVEDTKLETKVEDTNLETKAEEIKLETIVETFADRHKLIKPLHLICLLLNFPRIVLWEKKILQRGELELFTGLKILSSAASIASTEALYHRSMRSYLHKNREMSWIPTGIYFLWNLLLIIPRVTALALFCSVLPRYIIAHFLSLWMLLVLGVWSQKTDHMESPGWEWLFRATVGITWYFSWFNVSTGSITLKAVLYNCVMGLDTVMLLGFWCWKEFEYTGCWSSLNPYIVIPTLLGLHVVGFLVKMMYYRWFHPNCDEQKIAKPSEHQKRHNEGFYSMNTGSMESLSEDRAPAQPVTGVLKRGRNMAANFYY